MRAPLSHRLVEAFNREGVEYCHWKSNVALAEGLSGDLDLDLFVERVSLGAALRILAGLGFKPATVRSGSMEPGVTHHYGLDPADGRFVHVHLFTRLLTGESLVKSHVFPFETMLLQNAARIGEVRVPSRSAELVLHVLRTFIKYGSLPDLVRLLRKPGTVEEETRWLRKGSDLSEPVRLLRDHCPVIEEPLFRRCVAALEDGAGLALKLVLARRVRRRLRVYRRRGAARRQLAYLRLVVNKLNARVVGPRRNKIPACGGAVIAFVGPDATGKSTLVSETAAWLGGVFAVKTVHAGKPPSSWVTFPLNVLLPLARRALPEMRRHRATADRPEPAAEAGPPRRDSLAQAVRAVALAWDRRRVLLKARRQAAGGTVVVCDRYPSDNIGAMDSPRLRPDSQGLGASSALIRRLATLEHRIYAQIPPPDAVVRLRVSLEVAKRRNLGRAKHDKHSNESLEVRHLRLPEWSRAEVRLVHDVDTDQPLPETLLRVKQAIWTCL